MTQENPDSLVSARKPRSIVTEDEARGWPRTTHGKLICPDCGQSGWFYFEPNSWVHRHAEHITCECGKVVAKGAIGQHKAHHKEDK